MAVSWTTPKYIRTQVDAAGVVLRKIGRPGFETTDDSSRLFHAFEVLDNWRASHAFPLNSMQMILRSRARDVDSGAFVAQRLKRLFSVLRKLRLQNSMRLSQMQDIGGCRAVVKTVKQVMMLRNAYAKGRSTSSLIGTKDYITDPSKSGYRGVHLIYEYHPKRGGHLAKFDGLRIEVQLRSQLQHAWATAVETVDAVTGFALKSSEGPEEWREALKNISSLFAYVEGTPPVAGALDRKSLSRAVAQDVSRLRMRERLKSFGIALKTLAGARRREDRYFLLALDAKAESLEIEGFKEGELDKATAKYRLLEEEASRSPGKDVVLVRAESIESLERAYPNYFLDSQFFLVQLAEAMAE